MVVDGQQEYSKADDYEGFRITNIVEGAVRYYNLVGFKFREDLDLSQPKKSQVAVFVHEETRRIKWIPVRDLPEEIDVEWVPRRSFDNLDQLHFLMDDLGRSSLERARKQKTTITHYKQPKAHPDEEHPQISKPDYSFALKRKAA